MPEKCKDKRSREGKKEQSMSKINLNQDVSVGMIDKKTKNKTKPTKNRTIIRCNTSFNNLNLRILWLRWMIKTSTFHKISNK